RWRWTAWAAFILAATAATMVRANGILLLTLPGCALIGVLVRSLPDGLGQWRKASVPWRSLWPLLVPFGVVVVVLAAWSVRNQMSRGYLAPTDLAPIVAANAPFNA